MLPINILIVDDKEENIIALEALLAERDDIALFKTTSPNEALRMAWENNISIALVDVQMPEMDGFELVEMLRLNPKTRDILVAFVTAISKEMKYAVKGYGTGAVDYIFKPLDPFITPAKIDSFIQLAKKQNEIRQKNDELADYAVMIKNSADMICTINPQTLRVINMNPAVEKIMGYKPAEVEGRSLPSLVIEKDREQFSSLLHEIVRSNQTYKVFETQFVTFDIRKIWVECRASYRNQALFLNISDISAQKEYESQLVRSKESAEYSKKVKENFLANMSHELRTPVNGILGIAKMLKQTQLDDQQHGMVDLLNLSSQSLLGVINDILDISKIESGKFSIIRTAINISDVAKGVIDLLQFKANEKCIDLILKIDDLVPKRILADALRINQILMNLLSNAIKFTERGYVRLHISVEQQYQSKVHLKFSVQDSGIGIAPERLSKIFESFEQADDDTAIKYGGTGLGLAIVKKLVELKGGTIKVQSNPGHGSIFSFYNWYESVDENNRVDEPEKEELDFSPLNGLRVLLAEDNIVNQFIVTKLFRDWGVLYDTADNGLKALDLLADKDYDLILMDTYMPEMDGYATTENIRSNFEEPKRSIPIISLSAAVLEHEQQKAITAGMNAVLSKPFQAADLYNIIQRVLNDNRELSEI